MNLVGGLEALGNFGEGYMQAGRQNLMDRMNALALQNAQLAYQNNKRNMQQQQDLSDWAMKNFNPSIAPSAPAASMNGMANPQSGQPGATPGQPGIPPVQSGNPSDYMDQLAMHAASIGDIQQANELWANAANYRTAQDNQRKSQSAVQTAELKRQQQSHSYVASVLGDPTINDSPNPAAEFQRRKLMILSDPMVTTQEAQHIAGMQYSPGLVDQIRSAGMTSSQQAQEQLRQLEMQERIRHDQSTEHQASVRSSIDSARLGAEIHHWDTQKKVGAAQAVPTQAQLREAAPIVANVVFGDQAEHALKTNPAFRGVDTYTSAQGKTTTDYNTLPLTNIVSRARQLMSANRALSFAQAVNTAAMESKNNGDWQTATTTTPTAFGSMEQMLHINPGPEHVTSSTRTEYTGGKAGTKDNPLPLPTSKKDLKKGAWYVKNGQKEQYNG